MIRQKFLKVLMWLRDHFHILVEVVLRLYVGCEQKDTTNNKKERDYDK